MRNTLKTTLAAGLAVACLAPIAALDRVDW